MNENQKQKVSESLGRCNGSAPEPPFRLPASHTALHFRLLPHAFLNLLKPRGGTFRYLLHNIITKNSKSQHRPPPAAADLRFSSRTFIPRFSGQFRVWRTVSSHCSVCLCIFRPQPWPYCNSCLPVFGVSLACFKSILPLFCCCFKYMPFYVIIAVIIIYSSGFAGPLTNAQK